MKGVSMFKWFKKLLSRKKSKHQVDYPFLRDVLLFQRLSESELSRLSDLFIYKYFKKDEVIFTEGFPHIVLYIVVVGKVKQYKDEGELEFLVSTLHPKMMFGGLAMFADTHRLVSAKAEEETTLIAINKADLSAFIKSSPGTGIKLLWNLGKYLSTDLLQEFEALKTYEAKK